MTDETNDVTGDETRPRPRPRPESADGGASAPQPGPVSAASRARRIGGLPAASAPAPAPKTTPAPEPKTKAPKTPKPAKAPKAARPAKPPRVRPVGDENQSIALWIPSIVLGAAIVILLTLIAVAGHGVYYAKSSTSSSARASFSEQVLAAAKTCMANINTYDYRAIPEAEDKALACTTGTFTAHLKEVFEKTIIPKAPAVKNAQVAQINYAGIQSVSPDSKQVNVLVYGQLSVTNVSQTTPRIDVFGTVVTLDQVGSKWLIAKYNSDAGVAGS